MSYGELKTRLQIAIHSKVNTGGEATELHTAMGDWFSKTNKHIVICDGGRSDPIETSAILVHHIGRWAQYVPIYDPIIFLEEFRNVDADLSPIIYLYDLDVLNTMSEPDVTKFFSYMKFALMCGIRMVLAIPCSTSRSDLDWFFKNKKVCDMMVRRLYDSKYFTKLEV